LSDKDIKQLSEKPTPSPSLFKEGNNLRFNKKDIVFEDGDLFIINKNS